MPHIGDLLGAGRTYSVEFPPPRTDQMLRQFEKTVAALVPLRPSFTSVTYGAGGSTKEGTLEAVLHIHHTTDMLVMPHLTCAGQSRSEIVSLVERYRDEGLENILALAGDPPQDGSVGDFTYATELIELLKEIGDFGIVVAAFPEVHPRSPDRAADRQWLAAKLEVADAAITQFFWDADHYFRLRDELDQMGIATPVIPSLFPILNVATAQRFTEMNGAEWPGWLSERLASAGDDAEAVRRVGVEVACEIGARLLAEDVPGLHVYSLNRAESLLDIWSNLGLS